MLVHTMHTDIVICQFKPQWMILNVDRFKDKQRMVSKEFKTIKYKKTFPSLKTKKRNSITLNWSRNLFNAYKNCGNL